MRERCTIETDPLPGCEHIPQSRSWPYPATIQPFVYQGHRFDTILAFLERIEGPWIVAVLGLKFEQAGNNLQVVLDPVVDLLQQHLFFLERGPNLLLRSPDGEK